MVAVLIMGTAIVAVLGAMGTAIRTSAQHRGSAQAGGAATSIAELIDNAPYQDCATGYASVYDAPTFIKPAGFTVNVTIKYLVSRTTATPQYTGSCTSDKGVQQITVKVTSPTAGGMNETVVVAKRKPA